MIISIKYVHNVYQVGVEINNWTVIEDIPVSREYESVDWMDPIVGSKG